MKPGFPIGLLVWSLIGSIALRFVFVDDVEYLGACLVYAVILGLVQALIEIKHE